MNYFASLVGVVEGSSEALEEAQSGLDAGAAPFDVEQVKETHLAYLHTLEQMLVGQIPPTQDTLADADACPFGQWYASPEPGPWADTPVFRDVCPIHRRFHETAQQIVALIQAGKTEDARALVTSFRQTRRELFARFDQLCQSG